MADKTRPYYLAIATANMMQCDPQYADTKAEAMRMRKSLRESGYAVTVFKRLPDGGLEYAR